MAILVKGTDFTTGDQVTATNLDNLVDAATFASGAVDNSTTQLSGGAIIVKDAGITSAKLASTTGSGAVALATSPTLVTPILGTPASGTLTNCTIPASALTGTTFAANVVTSSLTTVGALNSGSITSGFGSIDIGADSLTAGAGSFTTLAASGAISTTVGSTTSVLTASGGITIVGNTASGNTQIYASNGVVATLSAVSGLVATNINGTPIGATNPAAGSFTTLAASGVITGTANTSLSVATAHLNASDPSLRFTGTANTANQRVYDIEAASNGLRFRSFDDALTGATEMMKVSSTGLSVTGVGSSTTGRYGASTAVAGRVVIRHDDTLAALAIADNADVRRIRFDSTYGLVFSNASAVDTATITNAGAGSFTTLITGTSTPASAAASGTAGTITWDSSYIYVCTATNTWKRVAIATW